MRIWHHEHTTAQEIPMDWQSNRRTHDTTAAPECQLQEQTGEHLAGMDAVQRNRLLAKAVEYEILPRLMLAHRFVPDAPVQDLPQWEAVTPDEMLAFAHLVLHGDDNSLTEGVAVLRRRGVPLQGILLELLAPVARHLGELWERDLCDFTDVTVALGRLQQVLRDNSGPGALTSSAPDQTHSILLTPCPGEQHTFGLSVVAEFFHQAQWDVSAGWMSDDVLPSKLVQDQWFDVVGLSLGSASNLDTLMRCILDIRQNSLNKGIFIILGGPIFSLHPEYADHLTVDAVIIDGQTAPTMAAQLIKRSKAQV
jgi:methanogenic corrinoid protein MtbC1